MAENKHVLQESTNVWESGGSKESTNQVKTPSTKQKKSNYASIILILKFLTSLVDSSSVPSVGKRVS